MPTDRDQEIAYHLAGAVRLPPIPPATGRLGIVVRGWGEGQAPDLYLKLVHHQSLRVHIARSVHVDDVMAIRSRSLGKDAVQEFHVGREVRKLVEAAVAASKTVAAEGKSVEIPFRVDAVLYVPESASVLTSSHAGMTAAESAGFNPPLPPSLPGDRMRCEDCHPFERHEEEEEEEEDALPCEDGHPGD